MNAFIVSIPNRPGGLAKITETLALKGINITGFSGATCGDNGTVCLLTNDEAATREALREGRYEHHERELVVASLADRPGSLAEATRRFADNGINIEAAIPTGMSGGNVSVAFATDDPARAREAVGSEVLTGSTYR